MHNRQGSIGYTLGIIVLMLAIWGETQLQTLNINCLGNYWSPTLWLACGLITAFLGWWLLSFPQNQDSAPKMTPDQKSAWIGGGVFVAGTLFIGSMLPGIFEKYPVGPMASDIIPSIQLYVTRFLGGEYVYADLEFPGWTVQPTYLPMMWLPYSISELLQIDYRWTAYGVFIFALALWQIRIYRQGAPWWEAAIKAAFPFVILFYFAAHRDKVFGFAVELMPAGLYLILCLSLWNNKRWFMALAIVMCLLSRYAFSFWLPLYALFYLIDQGWKKALEVVGWSIIAVLAIYVLPFLSKDWGLLQGMLDYYQKTAVGQWYTQPWQEEGAKPFHLTQGLSYAIYFYDHVAGAVEERLAANKTVHLIASAWAAIVLLLGFFAWRKKRLSPKLYTLVALKFYLAVFYSLLYVPFAYLYMLPLLVSIPILYEIRFAPLPKSIANE